MRVLLEHGILCEIVNTNRAPQRPQISDCAGVTLVGAVLTYMTYTAWGPWTCANVPFMDSYMRLAPFIQPPLFIAAGVAHFTAHQNFCRFYPHPVRLIRHSSFHAFILALLSLPAAVSFLALSSLSCAQLCPPCIPNAPCLFWPYHSEAILLRVLNEAEVV
jgi:hypothetical protein